MSTRRLSLVSVTLMVMCVPALAYARWHGVQANKDQKTEGQTMAAKPKTTHKKAHGGAAMKGVPSGVPNCVDHLIKMASTDPLIAYEGHPSEIINDGLLWNDPKSKCSVGSDQGIRDKVQAVALAWNLKDAAKVRSLLEELKSATGGMATETPKPAKRKHSSTKKATATGNKNAGAKQ